MMQYFEWYLAADTKHWVRLKEAAERLKNAGVTAVWLPPAYKGAYGSQGVGYTAYDLYDLGEFDQKGSIPTKYGTKQEYLEAAAACQEQGIQVYTDIVLNHKIGADSKETVMVRECAQDNRNRVVSGEEMIEAWTVFTFPGRAGKYSDFTWNASHFDGTDWDDMRHKNGIYLMHDKSWEQQVDAENGNYDYLMGCDIDFGNEEVVQELQTWGKWYQDTVHMDGFRLDAVKHIGADFYKTWVPAMRTYSNKELFTVGEYWSKDVHALERYLSEVEGCMSLFDVPLHWNMHWISNDAKHHDLREIFKGSLVAENPTHAVTFVDNHDTQPGQALSSWVAGWFKLHAYALILLRQEGYPCVFYGDYYGIPHDNIGAVGEGLGKMMAARRDCAYGQRRDYSFDYHCIGWTLAGDDDHEGSSLAVLMSTKGEYTVSMDIGKRNSGRTYQNLVGGVPEVVIDENGMGTFRVCPGSVSVWTLV